MRLQLGFSPRPTFEVAASKAGDISRSILKSSYKQEKEKVKQIANIPFPAAENRRIKAPLRERSKAEYLAKTQSF